MVDYRKMYDDKDHIYAFDLDGRERTLEIERCTAGELVGEAARKSKKPIVSFVGEKKKLAINKTNGKIIAALYGTDVDRWVGELITIYPTTTTFGGNVVDCIRVRPQKPSRDAGRPPSKQAQRGAKASAEQSAIAAGYLFAQYEKATAADMDDIKAQRTKMWGQLSDSDREVVTEAAYAAKARIDAAAGISADEAAAIARDEASSGG